MGDPRKISKKYETPNHPWQRARIDREKIFRKDFGLKNQKEIGKMDAVLKSFTGQAKLLAIATSPQAQKEKMQLMQRAQRLGLLKSDAQLSDVLGLKTEDILNRRLQTMVVKKGLARSMNQSRQFIVHRHIMINGTAMTVPSYLVQVSEESGISFNEKSKLANAEHPERAIVSKPKKEQPKKEEKNRKEYRKPQKKRGNFEAPKQKTMEETE